jgi:hypothetical protein
MTKVNRWALAMTVSLAAPLMSQTGLTTSAQDNCDRGIDPQKVKLPCFVLSTRKVLGPPGTVGDYFAKTIRDIPKTDPGDLRFEWVAPANAAPLTGLRVVVRSPDGKDLYSGKMAPEGVMQINQRKGEPPVFALTKEGAVAVRKVFLAQNELALVLEYKSQGGHGMVMITRKLTGDR